MNVLVTSASRKVSLVEAFQRAVGPHGGHVVAADHSPRSAALLRADRAVILPRDDDPRLWEALVSVIREQAISLLVPTRDAELPYFAGRIEALSALGVTVPISSPRTIALCQDKHAFARFCTQRGFRVARRLDSRELADDRSYPVFARASASAGGRSAFRVGSREELGRLEREHGPLLVEELVRAPELSLDVLADLRGRVISVVPRLRTTVVAGESYVSETVWDPDLVSLGVTIAEAVELRGHAVLQVFDRRADEPGRLDVIELNLRLGGASALSFAAGADSAALLVAMARGERVEPILGRYEAGLTMLRYTEDVFVRSVELEAMRALRDPLRPR